jgi:hypothetical protein
LTTDSSTYLLTLSFNSLQNSLSICNSLVIIGSFSRPIDNRGLRLANFTSITGIHSWHLILRQISLLKRLIGEVLDLLATLHRDNFTLLWDLINRVLFMFLNTRSLHLEETLFESIIDLVTHRTLSWTLEHLLLILAEAKVFQILLLLIVQIK